MKADELKALEQPIIEIARRAGRHILEIYDTAFEVQRKADKSPITEADTGAHDIIVEGLRALTPGRPILSEEGADIDFSTRNSWERYWLVDPLDGTREFVKRNGEFAVIVALIERNSPVLGVVYAPVLDIVYYASRDNGAHKISADGTVPIEVQASAHGVVRVAGSRSHSDKRLVEYLDRLGKHELVSMGSALKACLVAEGKADLYPRFGPTSEWDTAGAQCIVEEAGGALTDFDLRPLTYNERESLINPSFFVFGDKDRDWSAYL